MENKIMYISKQFIEEMSVSAGLPAFESPSVKRPVTTARKVKNVKEKNYNEDEEETQNVSPGK